MNPMLEKVRELFKPSLSDDLEGQMRGLLRHSIGRSAPRLLVFVSQDRLPPGVAPDVWAAEEEARLDTFTKRWAADNSVDWRDARMEVVILDTIAKFAWIRPGVEAKEAVGRRSRKQSEAQEARAAAELQFVGGQSRPIRIQGAMTLGRIAGEGIIAIQDPQVSRRHLALRMRDGALFARDLGSTHGTFLNDATLDRDREVQLEVGDVLRIGAIELRVTRIA